MLGPSGVGKSTVLNLIAGFISPSEGRVWILGDDATTVPPHRRNLGFIFQEYALFPHMTVEQNVRFPLDMRRVGSEEAGKAVRETLGLVGLTEYGDRRPSQLSGGQRQRVAIARALSFHPQILLMDEPLSSLDRQLRDEMALEIRALQQELGLTAVYVTHDQTEALTLSDRIGILRDGELEQLGTPQEVHDRPHSTYAAQLCGPLNTLVPESVSVNASGDAEIATCGTVVRATVPESENRSVPTRRLMGVRPYVLQLVKQPPNSENALEATVRSVGMVGNGVRYDLDLPVADRWYAICGRAFPGVQAGDRVFAVWDVADTMLIAD